MRIYPLLILSFLLVSCSAGEQSHLDPDINTDQNDSDSIARARFVADSLARIDTSVAFLTSDSIIESNAQLEYEIQLVYPIIRYASTDADRTFNSIIRREMGKNANDFRDAMKEVETGSNFSGSSTLDYSFETKVESKRLISVLIQGYKYYRGAAHPNTVLMSRNYDREKGDFIDLIDLARDRELFLDTLSQLSRTAILQNNPDLDSAWVANGTSPDPDNFQVYFFGNDTLYLVFNSYQVAPYAAGPISIRLPLRAFGDMIDRNRVNALLDRSTH